MTDLVCYHGSQCVIDITKLVTEKLSIGTKTIKIYADFLEDVIFVFNRHDRSPKN